MSELNLPKGWAGTAWEVRYGDARVRVSRRWQEYVGSTAKKLIVEWSVAMAPEEKWRSFDGVTNGQFDSEGDLATDLATAVTESKKALLDGVKKWTAALALMP